MKWGPEAKQAAVCVSFDNFGEALQIERNQWPADKPVGQHVTARKVLPALLADLQQVSIKATFFLEGWNGDVYADAIGTMVAAGHEIAIHGWRHEVWAAQTAEQQRIILHRSKSALAPIAGMPVGFRPPGGTTPDASRRHLIDAGLAYESGLGDSPAMTGQLVSLPFRWEQVDALYFEPALAYLREDRFESPDLRAPKEWQSALTAAVEEVVAAGSCCVVIFHPYLLGRVDGGFEVFRSFLQTISGNPDLWLTRCREAADWYRRQSA